MYTRAIIRPLTGGRETVAVWADPKLVIRAATLQLTSWVDYPAAPTSHLPRMYVRWGHRSAQHGIVADLPGYARIPFIGSGISVVVWSEQDDLLTPTPLSAGTPVYHVQACISEGASDATLLTYTSRPFVANVNSAQPVPYGAARIYTALTPRLGPATRAVALPPGIVGLRALHAGNGGNFYNEQRFDINSILNAPQPVFPLARCTAPVAGPGTEPSALLNNFLNYYALSASAACNVPFRVVLEMEV